MVSNGFDDGWKDVVSRGADAMEITLDSQQLEIMAFHAAELIKWNKKFNITAITDPHEVAVKHFVDALAVVPWIPLGSTVVDVGSGGGFPGLPLKICRPDVHLVMVDASRKKVSFLNHVVRMSGVTHAEAIHSRVEDFGKDRMFSGRFDVVVSRAFTALHRFVDLAAPLLSDQGVMVAMKGNLTEEEIEGLDANRFRVEIQRYLLPFGDHRRSLVRIQPSR